MEALLGTDHDEVIAARPGKPANAVRMRRRKLGLPPFRDRRRWYYPLTDRR